MAARNPKTNTFSNRSDTRAACFGSSYPGSSVYSTTYFGYTGGLFTYGRSYRS